MADPEARLMAEMNPESPPLEEAPLSTLAVFAALESVCLSAVRSTPNSAPLPSASVYSTVVAIAAPGLL